MWRQEKPTIAEESIAQAVLQWLEHRNADLNLAHQLLSCIRFGAVSPLALFELPEAIRCFRTRVGAGSSLNVDTTLSVSASFSSSSVSSADASAECPQQQQRAQNQLVVALRHLSSLFIMQDSTSPQTPSAAASSEFPASSPIRYLLSLNAHSFLPRCTVPGVVSFVKTERTFHYYTLSALDCKASTATIATGGVLVGAASSSQASPSHQLVPREAPNFFFRMQPPPEFVLVGVSSSRALNAFFMLHWHDSSRHDLSRRSFGSGSGEMPGAGAGAGLRSLSAYPVSYPTISSFDAQFGTPRQWAALDASHYQTVLTACFPDKMALCFSSGRELLAVPRKGAALVMVRAPPRAPPAPASPCDCKLDASRVTCARTSVL